MNSQNVTGAIRKIVPVLCVLFIAAYCVVLYSVIVNNTKAALVGTGLLLLFLGLYFAFYRNVKVVMPDSAFRVEDDEEVERFLSK